MILASALGGPFTWLLLVCSVISLTIILERSWALRRSQILPQEVVAALPQLPDPEITQWLRVNCQNKSSTLSRLLVTAYEHLKWSRDENVSAVQVQARQEVLKLERGLVILEIITGIAPLLGLVGTIAGIIPLFSEFGKLAAADNNLLASGIGMALNKTLLGLLVAIPSLVAWSYFNKRVERLAVELEGCCDLFLRRHYLSVPSAVEQRSSAPMVG